MEKTIDRLKQIRDEKKITIKEMADELNFSEQLLVMFELGELLPSEKQRAIIEDYIIKQI